MDNKKKKQLLIIAVAIFVLFMVGISYAYFVAPISRTNQTVRTSTGTLRLTLLDAGAAGYGEVIHFGETRSTTFQIENTGTLPVYANIYWKNLINTYLEGSLVYNLSYGDENTEVTNYETLIDERNVPQSDTASNKPLYEKMLFPANTVYNFKLDVTLVDSPEVDQTDDLNAHFISEFMITENRVVDRAIATLTALNLTPSEITPNYNITAPTKDTKRCYIGNTIVGYDSTAEDCSNVYSYLPYAPYDYQYADNVVQKQLNYIGKATWDSTANKCMYNGAEIGMLPPNLDYSTPDMQESYCDEVYSAPFGEGGKTIMGVGFKNVGAGTLKPLGKCTYNGTEITNEDNGLTTEEDCQNIYQIVEHNDSTYFSARKISQDANTYVGKSSWDSTNNKCMYNGEEIKYATSSNNVKEEDCEDVYNVWDSNSDGYINALYYKRIGQGNWTPLGTDEKGIFPLEDDYGISYIFRGDLTNNYVKFGKYADDYSRYQCRKGMGQGPGAYMYVDCPTSNGCGGLYSNCSLKSNETITGKDIYWRILRVNGDGSLRLIYDGTGAHDNNDESTDRIALSADYWDQTNRKLISGLTYNSVKARMEEWYEAILKDTPYEQYISDEVFCNDKSTASEPNTWAPDDQALGYLSNIYEYGEGQITTYFGSYNRYHNTSIPSFKCSQKSDAYTQNDVINGNGELTYPIGLITADEVRAGGSYIEVYNTYSTNYLYRGTSYWTMSPSIGTSNVEFYNSEPYSASGNSKIYAFLGGYLADLETNTLLAFVPVINISAEAAKTLVSSTVDGKTIYSLPNN